ncbi:MAG: ArsA family ATPase [Lachnospiraceae bacterium]|nr:ArsA family ATPase [Lachnospiraceae bacterium]
MSKIYIFTGKGGVGKSSVSAAHALKSASMGQRTILVSTDMAHNLSDIFEIKGEKDIVNVLPNLDLYEIDPGYVMENEYPQIMEYVTKLMTGTGDMDLSELGMIPGTEELFSLLRIADLQESGKYDRIIVDCAPTGETLSLLKFPELLTWYMEKLFPIGKVGVRVISPVSKHVFKVEMPNKQAMNDIEKLFMKLIHLQELLKDREITSLRIVTTPEKMVVEETKRNYMYLNLYNFNVDGLYINRILPADMDNAFFDQWIRIQSEYIVAIRDTFGALPIYEIPWYDEELKGIDNIQRIVDDVLKEEEVFDQKIISDRECFTQTEDGYDLLVSIPGVEKQDVDLYQAATDVVIKVGNFKRNIPLPNVLRTYEVMGASFEDGKLTIRFGKGE